MEFEKIYQLYFREVFLYVRSLTPDEVTAEEINLTGERISEPGFLQLRRIHILATADEKSMIQIGQSMKT